MRVTKSGPVLLLVALLAAGACAAPAEEAGAGAEDELRAGGADFTLPDVDAQRYEIQIAVDATPSKEALRASVKGTYVATRAIDELTLDFEGNEVDEVRVGSTVVRTSRSGATLTVPLPAQV